MNPWTSQMHPVVRVDLMKTALTNFYAVEERLRARGKPWSGKAADAVYVAMGRADIQIKFSSVARCHAFRNMTRKKFPKSLHKWLVPDQNSRGLVLHDVLIDAVAVAPLRRDGKFRIKEFLAAAEMIASERPLQPLQEE